MYLSIYLFIDLIYISYILVYIGMYVSCKEYREGSQQVESRELSRSKATNGMQSYWVHVAVWYISAYSNPSVLTRQPMYVLYMYLDALAVEFLAASSCSCTLLRFPRAPWFMFGVIS